MMNKEELIQHFFQENLTAQEQHDFEELLASDLDFRQEVEFQKNVQKAINTQEQVKLKLKLQGYEDEMSQSTHGISKWKIWAVAASIVILLGAGWLGYTSFLVIDYNQLYSQNFEQYPNTVYNISRTADKETLERKAFLAYETGDYKLAIILFNNLKKVTNTDYTSFYLALSYLNENNTSQAIPLFKEIIVNNTVFVAESYWYLGLTYLKIEDKDNALRSLKALATKYEYNKAAADRLIAQLE